MKDILANDKKINNNCFKFTEKLLYNYKEMDNHIENLEDDINRIKAGDTVSVRAIRYDDVRTSQTYNISRQIEEKVIDVVAYIQDLELEVYKEKRLKNKINKAINNLDDVKKDIVMLRYYESKCWGDISEELCYGEKTLRKYKNQAIKCISVELFGSKVFQEEEPELFDMLAI